MNSLEQSILKTISYFDIFDYPLTIVEIYKWLYQPDRQYNLTEVLLALKGIKVIENQYGFYFLTGRQAIIRIRLDHYIIAEKKFKIALRAAAWLRFLASVKMIAVCNNVGYNNASPESDIDFFIVAQKKHLWWTRLTVTLVTTCLGIRRKGDKVTDRVCLSFYIGSDHLNLKDISLPEVDPYLIYWFATLAPIYDLDVYEKFMADNVWLQKYLPNFYLTFLNNRRQITDNKTVALSKLPDALILRSFFGHWLELAAQTVQSKKMEKYFGKFLDQKNTDVVISAAMLKLHKTDRRALYKNLWQQKLQQFNNL